MHTKPASLALLLLLSVSLLTGCSSAPPPRPTNVTRGDYSAAQRHATALIERAIAKNDIPSISIALVDDQRVVWSQGFGYADLAAKRLATADTLYRVGSISKLFTDIAAMQLVEKGKLGLDEPVQKVLPGFAPKSWKGRGTSITPRMLMTHHSGLQRDVAKSFQSKTPQRFTELISNFDNFLNYTPGEVMSYSNVGLTVLGGVVEKQSGQRFEQQLQDSLLAPLGMVHSAFDASVSASTNMSKSYDGGKELPAVPLRDVPAGGLNSSVNDLSLFMKMVFAGGQSHGHQVLKADTLAEMLRAQNTNVALDFSTYVGLGWFLESSGKSKFKGGGLVASHNGAIDGYRSILIILPKHKLGVVVLTNSVTGDGPVVQIANNTLKVALEAKTGIAQPNQSDESNSKSPFIDQPLQADTLKQWVGDYTTPIGYVRIHSKDGKTLRLDALGETLQLRERADGRFGLSYKLLGILPINLGDLGDIGLSRRSVDGREVLVALDGLKEALAGERIKPSLVDANFRRFADKYAGKYEVTNWGDDKVEATDIRVLEENGLMMTEFVLTDSKQRSRVLLKPLNDNQAIVLGALADGGDMVQALPDENGQIRVKAMGLVLRKVAEPHN